MIKLPLVDRFKFMIERQFVKGAGFQLLIVAAFIGLISMVGGMAVHWLGGESDLGDSVWWAFLRLTDPGYLGDDQGSWRRFVSTILTVSGYVVFLGALVAIMTQWLIARMREFERGLTPVSLSGHVVIVGWTNRTLPLLRELIGNERARDQFQAAFGLRRLRAVVLARNVSAAQSQALRSDPLLRRRSGQVILRDGSPLEEEAIHRAGCLQAAVVIMPSEFGASDSTVGADVETIRSLLSIDARADQAGQSPPLVVAEIQDIRRVEMARNAYRGSLELVPSDDAISRLITQAIRQPGMSAVYREIFSLRGENEILMRTAEQFSGARLADAASQCPDAIVLGLLRPGPKGPRVWLLPPSDERILKGDRLVVLAREVQPGKNAGRSPARLSALTRAPLRPPLSARRQRHRVLLLGWNERVPNLLMEMSGYTDDDFEITLVSSKATADREERIRSYFEGPSPIGIDQVEADFLLSGVLERFDLKAFSSIVLLSSDRLASEEEADARAIVGHRVLEGLLEGLERKPQILLELADPANEGLIRRPGAETIVFPLIVSHLLSGLALQPAIRQVTDELFTPGGAEIVFRRPAAYELAGNQAFHAIEARVAGRGEILLGVERGPASQHPGLRLNPARVESFDLDDSSRLCVLTRAPADTGTPHA